MTTRFRRRRRPSRAVCTALAVASVLAVPAVSSAQANGAVVRGRFQAPFRAILRHRS